MKKSPFLLISLAGLMAGALPAEDSLPLNSVNRANEIIDAAIAAHGGAEKLTALNSLAQEGAFTNYAVGQSRKPNPPWDQSTASGFNAIDFEKKIFVARNRGSAGGFDFDAANIVDGENAWQVDYRGDTVAPVAQPDFNTASGPFVRVTPALLMKQLQNRRQASNWLGVADIDGRPHDVITLVMEVGPGLGLYIDQETHMLTRMERVLPPFGQIEYRFSDYERIDGIAFNRTFQLLVNGDTSIDIVNSNTRVNVPVAEYAAVDDGLEAIPEITPDDFNLQEIAEGVFLVGGTGAYGLIVEMRDYLVAIGGTQGAAARIAEAGKHVSGKPVRYGVLTHHHSDHVPAAADYAREGATIITFRENEAVVREASGVDDAKLEFVEERMTLTDGARSVELIDIGPTPHAEHMLIAYLPAEGIVFEADHFPQPRTGPLPPVVPVTIAFAEALAGLDLDYTMIAGAHSPRVSGPDDMRAVMAKGGYGSTGAGTH